MIVIASIAASIIAFQYHKMAIVWMVPAVGTLIASFLAVKERQIRLLSLILVSAILTIGLSYTTQYVFDNVLKPHQQERINIWLRPEKCDPRGPLYNLIQSKLAIGSGGFTGKGFLNGEMTKLNYVPEQSTDFIFSIVGEEQGFIGTASVIILFLLLIIRSIVVAERAKLEFIRNYAYGVAGIFCTHVCQYWHDHGLDAHHRYTLATGEQRGHIATYIFNHAQHSDPDGCIPVQVLI